MKLSLFEKNMQNLDKMKLEHVELVEPYEVEATKDGFKTYKYETKDGKKRYLHSLYNCKSEIDNLLNSYDLEKDSVYVVYGLGLGYHIKELKKRITKRSMVLVIENDIKVLSTFVHNENLGDIFCDWYTRLYFGDIDEIVSMIEPVVMSFNVLPMTINLKTIILPSYTSIFPRWIESVNTRIIDAIRHAHFLVGNDVADTIEGIENNFYNLKPLIKSFGIEYLKDSYKNLPAIIVSAGPSLDKNIKQLKNAQGKALILATDAVIEKLKKENIKADAFVCIERGIETYDAFFKDKTIDPEMVFIGPPVITSEIFRTIENNKKIVALKEGEKINEWINDDILQEKRLLKMGTSCAHIAFSFARFVGADPIIFVGQDLAFKPDGTARAEGILNDEVYDLNREDIVYVKGINGEMLPTDWIYNGFLIWFELEMSRDTSGRLFIDATEGGAYKKGTIIMKLEEAIDKYCVSETKKLYDMVPEGKNKIGDKKDRALKSLEHFKKDLLELKEICEKYLFILDDLKKKYKEIELQDEDITDIFDKLKYLEEKIYPKLSENDVIISIFQCFMMTTLVFLKALGYEINKENVMNNIGIHNRMTASILVGTNSLLDSLEKIFEKVSAIEED